MHEEKETQESLSDSKDILDKDVADNQKTDSIDIIDAVASLTDTLQRVQAEYINYRKRVERDKEAATIFAFTYILQEFLPVLDDLDRAGEHGELVGGFKAISDRINNIVESLGLTKFSDIDLLFDPEIHEAIAYELSAEITQPTVTKILQPGYKYKNKIIRAARVVVSQPQEIQ